MKVILNQKNIIVSVLTIILIIFLIYIFQNRNSLIVNPTSQNPESNLSDQSFSAKNLIFIGDSGTGDQRQLDTANAIEKFCSKNTCDSMEIVGDVIYTSGAKTANDSQFQTKFEKPYQNLKFSIYIAYGNHDYLGCTDCYLEYSKKSDKFKMPAKYYSYKRGDIEIFVIDTENFNKDQQIWLENSLNSSSAKFKIVSGHRPLLTYDDDHYKEKWNGDADLLNIICNKVDIFIAGHAHLLEDNGQLNNCKFTQLVSGGGGAEPRQIVSHPEPTFNYSGNGFLTVFENKDNKIEYTFYDTNNNILRNVILN